MKLTVYDKTNSRQILRKAGVRITATGVIYFNSGTLELMKLSKGDCVSIANDTDNPKDWYLFRDANGFPLSVKSGTANSLGIACNFLSKKIRESLNIPEKKSFSLELAPKPTTENGHLMYALLTSKPML